MRPLLLLGLLLNFLFLNTTAQTFTTSILPARSSSTVSSAPSSTISQTPEMSASSVSSVFAAIATSQPIQPGGDPAAGDAGSTAGAGDSAAGAAGHDSGSITLSKGAIVGISVAGGLIIILGIASSVLWYLAKKRSWEVRAKLRKSARKVAMVLTPRRSAFPKDVQNPRRKSTRGLTKIEEVPNTPQMNRDVEKGNSKMAAFEMADPPKKSKWSKAGR